MLLLLLPVLRCTARPRPTPSCVPQGATSSAAARQLHILTASPSRSVLGGGESQNRPPTPLRKGTPQGKARLRSHPDTVRQYVCCLNSPGISTHALHWPRKPKTSGGELRDPKGCDAHPAATPARPPAWHHRPLPHPRTICLPPRTPTRPCARESCAACSQRRRRGGGAPHATWTARFRLLLVRALLCGWLRGDTDTPPAPHRLNAVSRERLVARWPSTRWKRPPPLYVVYSSHRSVSVRSQPCPLGVHLTEGRVNNCHNSSHSRHPVSGLAKAALIHLPQVHSPVSRSVYRDPKSHVTGGGAGGGKCRRYGSEGNIKRTHRRDPARPACAAC